VVPLFKMPETATLTILFLQFSDSRTGGSTTKPADGLRLPEINGLDNGDARLMQVLVSISPTYPLFLPAKNKTQRCEKIVCLDNIINHIDEGNRHQSFEELYS